MHAGHGRTLNCRILNYTEELATTKGTEINNWMHNIHLKKISKHMMLAKEDATCGHLKII